MEKINNNLNFDFSVWIFFKTNFQKIKKKKNFFLKKIPVWFPKKKKKKHFFFYFLNWQKFRKLNFDPLPKLQNPFLFFFNHLLKNLNFLEKMFFGHEKLKKIVHFFLNCEIWKDSIWFKCKNNHETIWNEIGFDLCIVVFKIDFHDCNKLFFFFFFKIFYKRKKKKKISQKKKKSTNFKKVSWWFWKKFVVWLRIVFFWLQKLFFFFFFFFFFLKKDFKQNGLLPNDQSHC